MSPRAWSFLLQWSRTGIGAAVFLIAARYLSLAEIGAFATAYAPFRMAQSVFKSGLSEAVCAVNHRPGRLEALLAMSVTSGLVLTGVALAAGFLLDAPILLLLSCVPAFLGISAISEALLRHRLDLRTLALRTAFAQSLAAALCLWLVAEGVGARALAGFVIAQVAVSAVWSVIAARWWPTVRPALNVSIALVPLVTKLAARDLLSSGIIPLAQIAVGTALGMTAAGTFQIATRMMSLIDALSLSPLRFLALPDLRRSKNAPDAILGHLRVSAALALWIWTGTVVAAPMLLEVFIGPLNAQQTAPVLVALAPAGVAAALVMPFAQGLIAATHVHIPLKRAFILLALFAVGLGPALTQSTLAVAIAFSSASVLSAVWLVHKAMHILRLERSVLQTVRAPMIAASVMMIQSVLLLPYLATADPLPALTSLALTGTATYTGSLWLLMKRTPRRGIA
jgi:O-antigen/teichoic acid export membrane protein